MEESFSAAVSAAVPPSVLEEVSGSVTTSAAGVAAVPESPESQAVVANATMQAAKRTKVVRKFMCFPIVLSRLVGSKRPVRGLSCLLQAAHYTERFAPSQR